MIVIGEVDSLHFFCSPCELEVFKLINNHHSDNPTSTNNEPSNCDVFEVTSTITAAIKGLQDALQNTIVNAISQQFKESPLFDKQSLCVEEGNVDMSQEMECQSQVAEYQRANNPQPKLMHHPCHEEITAAVSSVLKEEKEKSKRRLNIILHNIPESDTDNVEVRKDHDTDTVKAIINQHSSIPASVLNVTRLGRKQSKPRLLRIMVASEQDKANILRNCVKIHNVKDPAYLGKVFITFD